MGVIGTNCQLCGVAVQHDHYVPSKRAGMLKIYRGSSPTGGHAWESDEDRFVFGPEHEWLTDLVAPPYREGDPVLRGHVEDGEVAGRFVAYGNGEDGQAMHSYCWRALGTPPVALREPLASGFHEWSLVAPYQHQLFAFRELRADGKAWWLVDPAGDSADARRNAARIGALAAQARARRHPDVAPRSVTDVLARDDGWVTRARGGLEGVDNIFRFRRDAGPTLEVSGYPFLVWFMRRYPVTEASSRPVGPALAEFDDFERALKASVEHDASAILVAVMLGKGQGQYLVYARDEAETQRRIEALPGQSPQTDPGFENERDDTWSVYFDKVWPTLNS